MSFVFSTCVYRRLIGFVGAGVGQKLYDLQRTYLVESFNTPKTSRKIYLHQSGHCESGVIVNVYRNGTKYKR